jgi:(p)ppGpp synthase/HD superfamily hydrolase
MLNNSECIYSNKLINKINNLRNSQPINIDKIKLAISLAKNYHQNQYRKSGEPYYTHPIEVACMITDYLPREDLIIASILHDTIEDTEMTYDIIQENFGIKIADHVKYLSRNIGVKKIPASETIEILFNLKKYDTMLIKLFDRLHNLFTIQFLSKIKQDKIIIETINHFIILSTYIGLYDVEEKIIKICNEYKSQ